MTNNQQWWKDGYCRICGISEEEEVKRGGYFISDSWCEKCHDIYCACDNHGSWPVMYKINLLIAKFRYWKFRRDNGHI